MATPTNSHSDPSSTGAGSTTENVRLFNLDLPAMRRTRTVFPEQSGLATISRVLDVACGTGAWVIQAAQVDHRVQFVGIDSNTQQLNSAREEARPLELSNVEFRMMSSLQQLDIPNASFDVVNIRFAVGFMPIAAWPALLQECMRVTRPGGVIRLTEGDTPITNSLAFERLNGMISRALMQAKHNLFPGGQNLLITPLLSRVLRNAGCQDIQEAANVANFSFDVEGRDELVDDFASTYQQVQQFLIQMGVASQEEVSAEYQRMLDDVQKDQFCGVCFYLTAWGKKP